MMIRFLILWFDKKWPVLFLVFIAFAWVIIVSEMLFPFYTNIDDEAVYILHAQTLLQGRLTLPVNRFFDDFFAPVSVVNQGDWAVFKYTPVHASFLALGQLLFGSMRSAMGLVAAGNVLLLYQLSREFYGQRRLALVAAAMFLLSPFFLIQSTTFLSYPTALLLYLAFVVLLLRGQSRQSNLLLMGAGAVLGLAFFARPYDAILFALPFGLLFVGPNVSNSNSFKSLLKQGGWVLVGFLPLFSLVLIYNNHFTGHLFRFPFLLWDPTDTIGFGIRGIHGSVLYDVSLATKALLSNLLQLSVWIFGGIILLGLVLWHVFTNPIKWPDFALLLLLIIFPVGYFFFWGSYLVTITGVTKYLGPFYYLPVSVPLVIFGAQGLKNLFQRNSQMAQLLGVIILVINCGLLFWHLAQAYAYTRENQLIYRPFIEQKLDQALVFLPSLRLPFLFSTFSYLSNTPNLDGSILYALDRDQKKFVLLDAYPERTIYRFDYHGPYTYQSDDHPQTALVKLERLQVDRFRQHLRIVNPADSPYVYVEVCHNKQCETYLLDAASQQGREYNIEWLISPAQVELKGAYQQHLSAITGFSPDHKLIIATAFSDTPERDIQQMFEYRFDFRVTDEGRLDLLLPPEEWQNPFWPVAEWQRKDIDGVMAAK
jgi:4-amino-4-deoxy-L-arabinose transferase-like glycosyltransferase